MRFGLLGTLDVRAGEGPVPLAGPKQRALLAVLLVNANRVVAREELIDELWGESPPATAAKAVQHYVSQLRKVLPERDARDQAARIRAGGRAGVGRSTRFERLVAEARDAEPRARGAAAEGGARALARTGTGRVPSEPFARDEAARLDDLRLAALEARIEADLLLGRHAELVGELEGLIARNPHRERLRGQLMLALYRSGRQADALEAYRDARTALDELGLEPGAGAAAAREADPEPGRRARASERVAAARVERVALPGPLVPEPPFPFVGRERELATLRALLERAENGEGGFVLARRRGGGREDAARARARARGGGARDARPLRRLGCGGQHAVRTAAGAGSSSCCAPAIPLAERVPWRAGNARAARARALAADRRLRPHTLRSTRPTVTCSRAPRPSCSAGSADVQPLVVVADDATGRTPRRCGSSAASRGALPEERMLVVAAFRDGRGDRTRLSPRRSPISANRRA